VIEVETRVRTLVVDDNRAHREAMMMTLEKLGHAAQEASTVADAQNLLLENEYDLVIVDMELPSARGEPSRQEHGLEVIEQARAADPDAAVLAITGFASIENAVQAMRAGASEYITKGTSLDEIRVRLARALEGRALRREKRQLEEENLLLRRHLHGRYGFSGIVGASPKMQELFDRIVQAAPKNHTVLVRGESGTGKELVARAIHYNSSRRERPLYTINCTALSHQLIESELFGHKRGSFTGATEDRKGLFEEAHGSTLFLDEIGDLPLETQPKLLRAIEQKEFKRVGENAARHTNVRIVAATNHDLLALVEEGRFREDLYARLEVITLTLPPLRERREDIPLLVQHFLKKLCEEEDKRPCPKLTEAALEKLQEYSWPRNVRELENVMTQALLFCDRNTLGPGHIRLEGSRSHAANREWLESYTHDLTLRESKEKLERDLVQRALSESGGNISRAAEKLGMQRPNLYRKMREFGLRPETHD
jgi:DNA-binding NtrC family response regulator